MKYFLYALCLSLIILKLTNYIDWSWWYVTMPIYGGALIWIILFVLLLIAKAANYSRYPVVSNKKSRFKNRLDDYMNEQRNKTK